jgi:cobalt-zinc-cadmium efflux system membrane fusion protein
MKSIYYISIFSLLLTASCATEPEVVTEEKAHNSLSINLNADQIKSSQITEGLPLKELMGLNITANGTIEVPPQNKTVISAQFGGFIKSLNVLDGSSVHKGETLFTIEHPELIQLQQDYLELIGNMEYLQAELERQKILAQQEAGSIKSMQLAKSQYSMAQAKKNGLKAKLDMAGVNMKQLNAGNLQRTISVVSPFNGVVTKLAVNVGAYAAPTEHLLEIIDLQHAHAEVIVFEKDVKHLQIGQPVKLSFSNDNEVVSAKVFLVGKEIGKDRTIKVHCHLDTENKNIAPGSYFKATIYTGEKEHYCIPAEAVVELNGKSVVFFGIKSNGGLTSYVAEEVDVLASENGKSAIIYINKMRKYSDKLVLHGAYDIMSAILISNEE